MTTILNFGRDAQGMNAYAPQFCDDKFSATLTNGVAETVTVPDNYKEWTMIVSIAPGSIIFVAVNATAADPAGATFAATDSELNPGPRTVFAGDVISLLTTNATTDTTVMFYANAK